MQRRRNKTPEVAMYPDMPPLRGTENWIADAEVIRAKILPQVDAYEAKLGLEERILKAKKEIQHCEMLQDACETIRTIDSAEWWGANKDVRITNLIANQYYILEAEDDVRNARPVREGVEKIMAENKRLLTAPEAEHKPARIRNNAAASQLER